MPYFECIDTVMLLKVQDGEIPQRPPDGIADPVWEFLERCWSKNPMERPSTAQVYESLSKLSDPSRGN